jgi:uncharacterized protein YjdB
MFKLLAGLCAATLALSVPFVAQAEDAPETPAAVLTESEPAAGEQTAAAEKGVAADAEKSDEAAQAPAAVDEAASEAQKEPETEPEPEPEPEPAPEPAKAAVATVNLRAHLQNRGWGAFAVASSSDSTATTVVGSAGSGLRMEALQGNVLVDGKTYGLVIKVHVQNKGWMADVSAANATAGTVGQALRLEAIRMSLPSELAANYDIYYRAYVQGAGWLDWTSNGGTAGSSGYAARLEALEVRIVAKDGSGAAAPATGSQAYLSPAIVGKSHVQNIGWTSVTSPMKSTSLTLGTTGRALRLEAFTLSCANLGSGSITYRAHVSNIGWMNAVSDGATAGTTGQAKRVEAVQISLSGQLANTYDVWYRVHVQNIGWMGWAKNGATAGTTGLARRVEAVEIKLLPKGSSAPGPTKLVSIDGSNLSFTGQVSSRSVGGSFSSVALGQTAGTTGKSLALNGFGVSVANGYGLSVGTSYSGHFSNVGWTAASSNGAQLAASGNKLEAIKISLTGEAASYFDVWYRTHISGYGWSGWAKNGAACGSTGCSRSIEAYQVVIKAKGAAAPGSTSNTYSDANGFLRKVSSRDLPWVTMANRYSSATNYMILVNTGTRQTCVLTRSNGVWNVKRLMFCTVGASVTPTKLGVFTVGSRGLSFGSGYTCWYWTQYSGNYLFHSVLYNPGSMSSIQDGRLGIAASHGCIRLALGDAKWIYDTVPYNSRVVLW